METFVCRPERDGPHPPVLLLMDAPGVRDELRDMARRLATVGYVVALPNLYYRAGADTTFGADVLDPQSDDHTRMRAIRTTMTIPPVMDEVADLLAHLDARPEVAEGAVGCHGYCMSGPYALAAAARYPDRIRAARSNPVCTMGSPSPNAGAMTNRRPSGIGNAFSPCIGDNWASEWPCRRPQEERLRSE